jgi:hypothetical protein
LLTSSARFSQKAALNTTPPCAARTANSRRKGEALNIGGGGVRVIDLAAELKIDKSRGGRHGDRD